MFLQKHNWVHEKRIRDDKWPDENGLFEVLGLENLAHGVCTDREGYVTLHSPEYCPNVLMGEPGMCEV